MHMKDFNLSMQLLKYCCINRDRTLMICRWLYDMTQRIYVRLWYVLFCRDYILADAAWLPQCDCPRACGASLKDMGEIDPSHKSHISITKWPIVGYRAGALWELGSRSIEQHRRIWMKFAVTTDCAHNYRDVPCISSWWWPCAWCDIILTSSAGHPSPTRRMRVFSWGYRDMPSTQTYLISIPHMERHARVGRSVYQRTYPCTKNSRVFCKCQPGSNKNLRQQCADENSMECDLNLK